tara:strand:- start:5 stop:214 length:210 start_codon:yes stop_codon:yes gene_type:complete
MDLVEFEEENFEKLLEYFLCYKKNKEMFEDWLEMYGYEKFLLSSEVNEDWNNFVLREFSERGDENGNAL